MLWQGINAPLLLERSHGCPLSCTPRTAERAADHAQCMLGLQTLSLADLKRVATLGSGAFGSVSLVRHGSSYYALKTMSKAQLTASGLSVRTSQNSST